MIVSFLFTDEKMNNLESSIHYDLSTREFDFLLNLLENGYTVMYHGDMYKYDEKRPFYIDMFGGNEKNELCLSFNLYQTRIPAYIKKSICSEKL